MSLLGRKKFPNGATKSSDTGTSLSLSSLFSLLFCRDSTEQLLGVPHLPLLLPPLPLFLSLRVKLPVDDMAASLVMTF